MKTLIKAVSKNLKPVLRWLAKEEQLPRWILLLIILGAGYLLASCKPSYEACQEHYPCEQQTITELVPDTVQVQPGSLRTRIETQYLTRWLRDTTTVHDTILKESPRVRTRLVKKRDSIYLQSDCKPYKKALKRLKKTTKQEDQRERPGWWERNKSTITWIGIGAGALVLTLLTLRFAKKVGL
jgi:hypothetical protein